MSELGSSRHLARERALEILYEAQMKERSVADVLAALPVAPDPYASTLALATESSQVRGDELLERFAVDWPLDRIAVIDRIIMTMATAELLMPDAPPRAVVLDEFENGGEVTYDGAFPEVPDATSTAPDSSASFIMSGPLNTM